MRSANCEYFVAGATARDIVTVHVHALRPSRATRDIDYGSPLRPGTTSHELKEHLIATGHFFAEWRALERLIYSDQGAGFRYRSI
jgi:predicted nucleotidyltransferase